MSFFATSAATSSTRAIETDVSEEQVSKRLMDFLNAAFKYYSRDPSVHSGNEALEKVVNYWDIITDSLHTHNKKWTATPKHAPATVDVSHMESKQMVNDAKPPPAAQSKELCELKESVKSSQAPGSDEVCRICLEPIGDRRVGIFEQCDHIYCELCTRNWIRESANNKLVKCPTCRVPSARVIFRARPLAPGPDKEADFDSMICVGPHAPPAPDEDNDDNDEELLNWEMELEAEFERYLFNETASDELTATQAEDDDPNDPDFVVSDSLSSPSESESSTILFASSPSSAVSLDSCSIGTIVTLYESNVDDTESADDTGETSFSESLGISIPDLSTLSFSDDDDDSDELNN